MTTQTPDLPGPGLIRRSAALLYDGFLLLALELIAGMPLPLIPESIRLSLAGRLGVFVWMLLVAFIFLGYCWTHGGQTLGMRAWKIRVQRKDGGPMTWADSAKRFLAAIVSWLIAALGFIWIAIDRRHRAWHDMLSATVVEFDDRWQPRGKSGSEAKNPA